MSTEKELTAEEVAHAVAQKAADERNDKEAKERQAVIDAEDKKFQADIAKRHKETLQLNSKLEAESDAHLAALTKPKETL